MERIVGVVLAFIAASGFYLFLSGTVDTVEVSAGIVGAAAAALMIVGMDHVAERHYACKPPLRVLIRPLMALLPETFSVGRILVAVAVRGADRQCGDFTLQPFATGDASLPTTRGRRALSVLGISLAPRTFVVRGETDGPLLLHGLPAKPASPDTRWPV